MGLYVIGMHRSGTSALTGLLAKLLDQEMESGPVESNPLGQWELAGMRPALDLLLLANRSTWAHPLVDSAHLEAPKLVKSTTTRAFAKECQEPFIWKDPRLCLTIDYWLSLDQAQPKVVFIHRDPLEVAASLADRNGWATERGLALWERTNRNAIARLGGREVVCIGHRELMASPSTVATDLTNWLSLDPSSVAQAEALSTIQPKQRSDKTGGTPLTPAMESLSSYLRRQSGPATLSLATVGSESDSTATQLGSPGLPVLGRQLYRSLRQMVSS